MNATSYIVTKALMIPGDVSEWSLEDFAAPRPAWQARGACRDEETALFFIERGGDPRPARQACAGCPVKAPCLEYAMADPSLRGVWGGTSERERQRMRRELPAAA